MHHMFWWNLKEQEVTSDEGKWMYTRKYQIIELWLNQGYAPFRFK